MSSALGVSLVKTEDKMCQPVIRVDALSY